MAAPDHAGLQRAYLIGPGVTDLPPRLYFAYVDFIWLPEIVHRYKLYLVGRAERVQRFRSNDADASASPARPW